MVTPRVHGSVRLPWPYWGGAAANTLRVVAVFSRRRRGDVLVLSPEMNAWP